MPTQPLQSPMHWYTLHRYPTDTPTEHHEKENIYSFLEKLKWGPVEQSSLDERIRERPGMGWIELLALYERHGGRPKDVDADRAVQLADKGEACTREEKSELEDLRDELIRTDRPLPQVMAAFKRRVRCIAKRTLHPNEALVFQASKSQANRLGDVAINNKQPTLRGTPAITEEDTKAILEAILRQKGISDPKKLDRWRCGQLELKPSKFRGKGKVAWRQASLRGQDWTRDKYIEQDGNGDKVRLDRIHCPRCHTADGARGRKLAKEGIGWNLVPCNKCQSSWSANDWTCSCGVPWHMCNRHQHTVRIRIANRNKHREPKNRTDDPLPASLRDKAGRRDEANKKRQARRADKNDKGADPKVGEAVPTKRRRIERAIEMRTASRTWIAARAAGGRERESRYLPADHNLYLEVETTPGNDNDQHSDPTMVNDGSGLGGSEQLGGGSNTTNESDTTCDTRNRPTPSVSGCFDFEKRKQQQVGGQRYSHGNDRHTRYASSRINSDGEDGVTRKTTTEATAKGHTGKPPTNKDCDGGTEGEATETNADSRRSGDCRPDGTHHSMQSPPHAHTTTHCRRQNDTTEQRRGRGNANRRECGTTYHPACHFYDNPVPSGAGGWGEGCMHHDCNEEAHVSCTECVATLCCKHAAMPPHHEHTPSRCHEHNATEGLCRCMQCRGHPTNYQSRVQSNHARPTDTACDNLTDGRPHGEKRRDDHMCITIDDAIRCHDDDPTTTQSTTHTNEDEVGRHSGPADSRRSDAQRDTKPAGGGRWPPTAVVWTRLSWPSRR